MHRQPFRMHGGKARWPVFTQTTKKERKREIEREREREREKERERERRKTDTMRKIEDQVENHHKVIITKRRAKHSPVNQRDSANRETNASQMS